MRELGFVCSPSTFSRARCGTEVTRCRLRCGFTRNTVFSQTAWLGEGVCGRARVIDADNRLPRRRSRWCAVLGGGGFFGVGPSEMVVVFLVGWFLLGPKKLYELSKDVGRIVGDLRRAAADAQSTFTEALEAESLEESSQGSKDEKADPGLSDSPSPSEHDSDALERRDQLSTVSLPERDDSTTVPSVFAKSEKREDDLKYAAPTDNEVGNVVSRQRFLEQLQRSQNPGQVPPSLSNPDNDEEDEGTEEDLQVAKLEYELAKARLEAKLKRRGTSLNDTGPEAPMQPDTNSSDQEQSS